jgi:predicted dehydrogenase
MQTPIGIAVLSFAHGHANAYCDVIATFDDANVLAAWDDNEQRGRAASEKYGLSTRMILKPCYRAMMCRRLS